MATLEEMLAKVNASNNSFSKPKPLYDKAMAIVNDQSLALKEKKQAIDELALQANGYESECFSDVYEALIVSADSMDDIVNMQGDD